MVSLLPLPAERKKREKHSNQRSNTLITQLGKFPLPFIKSKKILLLFLLLLLLLLYETRGITKQECSRHKVKRGKGTECREEEGNTRKYTVIEANINTGINRRKYRRKEG